MNAKVFVEWTGAILGLLGSLLLALKVDISGYGFIAFLISNVCWLKSQEGVRRPTGRLPDISSSVSAERRIKSRSASRGKLEFSSWIHPWMPISWPSATTRRCSSG